VTGERDELKAALEKAEQKVTSLNEKISSLRSRLTDALRKIRDLEGQGDAGGDDSVSSRGNQGTQLQ
jgi:uncharacterized coiled-coil DUF342 family protein